MLEKYTQEQLINAANIINDLGTTEDDISNECLLVNNTLLGEVHQRAVAEHQKLLEFE